MTAPVDVAGRAWDAAYELDELRGDRKVSEWCARKIRDLIRADRAHDIEALTKLADVLEDRLEAERARRQEGVG